MTNRLTVDGKPPPNARVDRAGCSLLFGSPPPPVRRLTPF
jgi:hypothetical protein